MILRHHFWQFITAIIISMKPLGIVNSSCDVLFLKKKIQLLRNHHLLNNNRLFINYVLVANISPLFHSYLDIWPPIKHVNLCNLIAWRDDIICVQICHLLSFNIKYLKVFSFSPRQLFISINYYYYLNYLDFESSDLFLLNSFFPFS